MNTSKTMKKLKFRKNSKVKKNIKMCLKIKWQITQNPNNKARPT
jgi:hypothetical protein